MNSTCAPLRFAARLWISALCLGLPVVALAQDEGFRDDFDTFDRERWYVSDGWSNGDWQACTWSSDMLSVDDGMLTIGIASVGQGSEDYLCGEIQTDDVLHYGTYEIRVRTDAAMGVNAAFFTYIGPVHGVTHNEIDIEVLGRQPEQVEFNTYLDGEAAHGAIVPLPEAGRADEGFHTYAFVWEEDRIRWYVDGVLLHEATGPDLPQEPQKLYISHWNTTVMTDWMGLFVDPGQPVEMEIDWVAFTPLGADCQFEESVACQEAASP
jgi:endo-1,3-1,4-beta-glycanase ExoK